MSFHKTKEPDQSWSHEYGIIIYDTKLSLANFIYLKNTKLSDKTNKDSIGVSKDSFPVQEYRLVPIENSEDNQVENEINIGELIKKVVLNRVLIIKISALSTILGVLVAVLSPVEFEAGTSLIPETGENASQVGSLIQKYGSVLGIGGNINLPSNGDIPPELHPQIVNSLSFHIELLEKEISFEEYDTLTTVYTFFNDVYSPTVFSYLAAYTVGLPGKIKGLIVEDTERKSIQQEGIINITKEQMDVIEIMQSRVMVTLDEQSGIITLQSKMPDRYAAAEVVKISVDILTRYLTEYKTQKILLNLKFIEEQFTKAKIRYEKLQNDLAITRDRNKNLTSLIAQTELERIQNDRDIAFNLYNSLTQQLEQTKILVQEQTPVYSVLQPVYIPIEKSSPKRVLITIGFFALGLMAGIGLVLLKKDI